MKDLTGQRFGRLVVLEVSDKRKNGRLVWKCICDCGNKKEITSSNLIHGKTQSCGCISIERATQTLSNLNKDTDFMKKRSKIISEANKKDITGQRFGKLVALKPTDNKKYGSYVWEFKCDCGNKCYKVPQNLHDTSSCGCLATEIRKSIGDKNILKLNSECAYDTNVRNLTSQALRSDNTSGIKGVYWNKQIKRWYSRITLQKKTYHLGYFSNKKDAIKARKYAESMTFEPFLKWYEEQKKVGNKEESKC